MDVAMLTSATSPETQILQLIWQSALILILSSLLVTAILIFKRKLEERREARKNARYERLSNFIHATLRLPPDIAIKNLPELGDGDEAIIMRITLDMLGIMRGNDKGRVIDILEKWNLFPYLRQLSEKGARGKRIQALTLLGYFSDIKSLIVLMDQTTADDINVQLAALHGLAERKATKYIDEIIERLQVTNKTNSLILADILGRFGENALTSLLRLMQSKAGIDVRIASILAIEQIGSLEAIEPLLQALTDPEAEIRAQAASTLGKLGDAKAGAALMHCLSDESKDVRLQAVLALGQLSYQEALPALVKALDDKEWSIRFRAAQALYKLGDNGIAMLKALSRIDNEVGALVSQVLGEMDGINIENYTNAA
jgi:hypothetical protein